MAKSCMDLKGAKSRSLKLDAEQLARALAEIRSKGGEARGYLLVLADRVARRARQWEVVLQEPDLEVIVAILPDDHLEQVQQEKLRNAEGIKSGVPSDSVATISQQAAEQALRSEISRRHAGVRETRHRDESETNWDFKGIL